MFKHGARVYVSRDVDLSPHTVLKTGETGVVVRCYNDSEEVYAVDVRMDKFHKGLAEWDNEAHLTFPEIEALGVVKSTLSRLNPKHIASIAACGVAWLLHLPWELWSY